MAEAMEAEIFGEVQKDELPEEFQTMTAEDIQRRWEPGHGWITAQAPPRATPPLGFVNCRRHRAS